ncbi:MAG: hypothetical protein K0R94_438 [Burkholderiales bacterium]|jgi:hypothetical protein|nr:hypothetical protein [Burkholderiales bacterium]
MKTNKYILALAIILTLGASYGTVITSKVQCFNKVSADQEAVNPLIHPISVEWELVSRPGQKDKFELSIVLVQYDEKTNVTIGNPTYLPNIDFIQDFPKANTTFSTVNILEFGSSKVSKKKLTEIKFSYQPKGDTMIPETGTKNYMFPPTGEEVKITIIKIDDYYAVGTISYTGPFEQDKPNKPKGKKYHKKDEDYLLEKSNRSKFDKNYWSIVNTYVTDSTGPNPANIMNAYYFEGSNRYIKIKYTPINLFCREKIIRED